ncbi:MAG TPA: hypothetical protein VGK54_05035 [Chloroflexota bacterium]
MPTIMIMGTSTMSMTTAMITNMSMTIPTTTITITVMTKTIRMIIHTSTSILTPLPKSTRTSERTPMDTEMSRTGSH